MTVLWGLVDNQVSTVCWSMPHVLLFCSSEFWGPQQRTMLQDILCYECVKATQKFQPIHSQSQTANFGAGMGWGRGLDERNSQDEGIRMGCKMKHG